MTEPRAKAVEPRASDALATLSDHLARLLEHADKLLREWEAHANGVRARMDAETESTGEVLQKALAGAMDGLSELVGTAIERAAGEKASAVLADLEKAQAAATALSHSLDAVGAQGLRAGIDELRGDMAALLGHAAPGRRRRPEQLLLILLLLANGLGVAVLIAVLARPSPVVIASAPVPTAPEPAPAHEPEPAPAVAAVVVPDAAPPPPVAVDKPRPIPPAVVEKPPPTPPAATASPCSHLPAEGPTRLVQVCVNQLCSPFPPLKVDGTIKPGGTLGKTLAACKAADRDLLAAIRTLERDKSIYRLVCPQPDKHEDGTVSVTVRWLLSCLK